MTNLDQARAMAQRLRDAGFTGETLGYADILDALIAEVERLTKVDVEPPRFPTMLRKMWSGREVQEWIDENYPSSALAALRAENEKLRTVMMAAAVEITEHWDAHCDSEGYGPANLVRRLENGFPEQYGYDAMALVNAEKRIEAAQAEVARLREDAERLEWIEQKLFVQKWNGVVGSDCSTHWGIAPDYRHTVHNMKNGDIKPDFRAAIDAARAALESK
jgi:hypothetical protein